jgi:prohibitin 2
MFYLFFMAVIVIAYIIIQRFAAGLTRRDAEARAAGRPQSDTAEFGNARSWGRFARSATTISRWVALSLVVLLTFAAGFHAIPAGKVGVVYQFGGIVGQVGEGPQWVLPWRQVRLENTQVQSHKFDRMACFSKESQAVYVDCTVNTRISERAVQKLYREVGPDWFAKLVEPRVPQYFKDETVKYQTVDIAPNRESIRHTVSQRLNAELSNWSIEVPDLLLNNIDFENGFKQAIESKQIATQRALEEEQRVKVVEFQAQQAVARARGKADSLYTIAERQAEANNKLSASLTDRLVQYTMVTKLAPNVNVALLPAGQQFILGGDIIGGKK